MRNCTNEPSVNATESIPSPITDIVKTRKTVVAHRLNFVEAHARDGDHHLVEGVDERPAHDHVAGDAIELRPPGSRSIRRRPFGPPFV